MPVITGNIEIAHLFSVATEIVGDEPGQQTTLPLHIMVNHAFLRILQAAANNTSVRKYTIQIRIRTQKITCYLNLGRELSSAAIRSGLWV